MTKVADRAFLDTNVLLAATDEGRAEHVRAIAVLDEWPAEGVALYASGQVLREYLCVATREVAQNGLGLTPEDALANIGRLRERLRLLEGSAKVLDRLLELLADIDCRGTRVHDANVVATILVHGIETIVTANTSDFARFSEHIAVVAL